MDWLNYHHLRYFWTAAREGSLARAAARLHVSQPSISEQIRELEAALGEKLFQREGRGNVLTHAGQLVFGYADEIFATGRELVNAVKQRPGTRVIRLGVGVADSFPKLVTNEILKPVFSLAQPIRVVCREGKLADLLSQLAAHRLDIVLADEPAPGTAARTFTHALGESGATFLAARKLAARLKPGFPTSLNGSPALLPAEDTPLRHALETWFREHSVRPRVVAECDDLALMKVMAADGRGFTVVPSIAADDAMQHYGFRAIGEAAGCRMQFHALTAERRITHPGVAIITQHVLRRPA